jgi:ubiquinone biosynthesis monooxygenase Coq7
MKTDEQEHAGIAESLSATEVPQPVKQLMKLASKLMTSLAEKT